MLNRTHQLTDLGQSLWLDNITPRDARQRHAARLHRRDAITGLTSNPTIFDGAIGNTTPTTGHPRQSPRRQSRRNAVHRTRTRRPAPRGRPACAPCSTATDGVDGWVSMEVSPLLAADTGGHRSRGANESMRKPSEPNLFVKIPGTPAGLPAIEEAIFAGVPINVTLLFSCEQYLAAAEAYLRGIERRIAAGLIRASSRSRRCSSVAGTRQSPTRCPPSCATSSASRSLSAHIALTGSYSRPRAGEHSRNEARIRNGCCGRAPARRTRALPTPCTSKRWRRPTPSTRCRKRRCARLPSTASCAARWPPMAATPRQCWRGSRSAGIDCDALAAQLQRDGAQTFATSWQALCTASRRRASVLERKTPRTDERTRSARSPARARRPRSSSTSASWSMRISPMKPEATNPAQRVAFGTSGHRGSSFDGSFNENHIIAISAGGLRVSRAAGHRRPAVHRHRHPRAIDTGIADRARGADSPRRRDGRLTRHADTRRRPRSRTRSSPQPRPHAWPRRWHRRHAVAQPAGQRRHQIQPAQWRSGRSPTSRGGSRTAPTRCSQPA